MMTAAAPRGLPRAVSRWLLEPLVHVVLAVMVLPWLVQPGVIQPDTKTDLVVDPGRYLARALDAWSTHSGFGELQNQAYGYLFPMGPIFWVGHELGMPGWAVQRVWWSLLLGVGAAGAALCARRVLHLSTPAAAIAAVAYALSPRVLTLLSELSAETWPGMVLPWFVVALAAARRGRWPWWRTAGIVGVLTACLGGVNATASLVPVLAAGLVALALERRLLPQTTLGVVLGGAWWLGPLVVLGRYSYPFMDYIETSHITTAVTSVPGVLRGASDWVAYIVDADGHPVWQSGWVVAQGAVSIIAGCLVAAAGLLGLVHARRSTRREGGAHARPSGAGPEPLLGAQDSGDLARRVWAALCDLLVLGVLGMGVAYVGVVSGPFTGWAREVLDGAGAPARNVHKLDPLVRLPIALGLAAVVGRTRIRGVIAGGLVLAAACAPFWQGRLGDAAGVTRWPTSLRETAADLDAAARRDGGSSLVLPSARSASFSWGTATDEPLSAFAASPIAVRASAPLVHPGAQRLMDTVDSNLAQGKDVDASACALRRAGVHRLVVESGAGTALQVTPSARYLDVLAQSSSFGGHRTHGAGGSRYDVFDVGCAGAGAASAAPERPVGVLGGPESTVTLAAAGVGPATPFVMGDEGGWITDDVRRRVYANGRPAALAFGATLPATTRADTVVGRRDLDFPGRSTSLSTLALDGVESISSRTSTADPFERTYLGPGSGPGAALDTSKDTAWLTPVDDASPLVLRFASGQAPRRLLALDSATGGAVVSGVVATADGRSIPVARQGASWITDVPPGAREVTLLPTGHGARGAFGFSEVRGAGASGKDLAAIVKLPGRVDPARTGAVLSRSHPFAQGHALRSEDDGTWSRRMDLAAAGTFRVNMTVKAGRHDAPVARWRRPGEQWRPLSGSGVQGTTWNLPAGAVDLELSADVERVVLTPESAAARSALGLTDGSHPAAPTTAGVGSGNRMALSMTQGANAGWTVPAETGTSAARAVVIDGWRQGFTASRPLTTAPHFEPTTWHHRALATGAATAGIAVLMSLLPGGVRRRRVEEGLDAAAGIAAPTTGWARRREACALAAFIAPAASCIVAVALAGWWALPLLALAACVPSRQRPWVMFVVAALMGPVLALFGTVGRTSLGAGAGQVLGVGALVLFILGVGGSSGWPGVRGIATRVRRSRDSSPS